nr:MAG: hypothetical protein CM15mV30_1970 [uncultured marine virus]
MFGENYQNMQEKNNLKKHGVRKLTFLAFFLYQWGIDLELHSYNSSKVT